MAKEFAKIRNLFGGTSKVSGACLPPLGLCQHHPVKHVLFMVWSRLSLSPTQGKGAS